MKNTITKIFLFLIIFFNIAFTTYAHIEHYKDINLLEFDLYRNNKLIGEHIFIFNRSGDTLSVNSKIKFEIKKLGISLYKYSADGIEVYEDGTLIKFNSKTNQNGKLKYVNIETKNNEYNIDGSSYKGVAPIDFVIGTWWNHSIIKAKAQISAVSGRIIKQNVDFLGKEEVTFNNKNYKTLHFRFSSSDKKLNKKKRLNTEIWYDENKMIWVKAVFEKQGTWEYRLRKIK